MFKRLFLFVLLLSLSPLLQSSSHAQDSFNVTRIDPGIPMPIHSMVLDGNILYAANYDYLVSFDVSDPASPVLLDTISWYEWDPDRPPPMMIQCEWMVVSGNYLYGAARYHGVIIFDISDPSNLKLVNSGYDVRFYHHMHIRELHIWNEFLIARANDSLYMVDVSNPTDPNVTAGYYFVDVDMSNPGARLSIVGDTLFGSCNYRANGNQLNDTVGLNVIRTAYLRRNGTIDFSCRLLYFYGPKNSCPLSTAILRTGSLFIQNEQRGISLYSITELAQPTLLSSVPGGDGMPYTLNLLRKVGDYLYCSERWGEFYLYDISAPDTPVMYAQYSQAGIDIQSFEVISRYVYLCTSSGIIILRIGEGTSASSPPAPTSLSLAPAYPNPFSGSTAITYSLPVQQQISLVVYNTLGQHVRTLYNGIREPGEHTAQFNAMGLLAGMYRIALRSGEGVKTRTVVVW